MAAEVVIVLALAAAPLIPYAYISDREVQRGRDTWLLGVLTCLIVALAPLALWLSLLLLWFLIHWPRHAEPWTLTPSLVCWLGVGATWLLLRHLPARAWDYLPWAWLGVGAMQVLVLGEHWITSKRPQGTLGTPVTTGMYLALILPLAWPWSLLVAPGMALTWSLTALGGAIVALGVLHPGEWLIGALGAILALGGLMALGQHPKLRPGRPWLTFLSFTPRGDSPDSVLEKLAIHRELWRHVTWRGTGPMRMTHDLRRWGVEVHRPFPSDPMCEVAHVVYEYGVLGALALLAFAVEVAPHLRLGDPWSAAVITGVVMSCAHYPIRHAPIGLVWLACCAKVVA